MLFPECRRDATDQKVIDYSGGVDVALAKIAGSVGIVASIIDVFQSELFQTPQVLFGGPSCERARDSLYILQFSNFVCLRQFRRVFQVSLEQRSSWQFVGRSGSAGLFPPNRSRARSRSPTILPGSPIRLASGSSRLRRRCPLRWTTGQLWWTRYRRSLHKSCGILFVTQPRKTKRTETTANCYRRSVLSEAGR